MNATHPLPADPVELVRRLDADQISDRLTELDRERDALLVLLRAARRVRPDGLTPPAKTRSQSTQDSGVVLAPPAEPKGVRDA